MNHTMKLAALGMVTALALPALAQQVQRTYTLLVNGQASSSPAVVIGGQSYVPVSALKELGIAVNLSGSTLSIGAAGGQNQVAALEGCLGQTLFNGNWRVTVQEADKASAGNRDLWRLKVNYGNASSVPNKLYINSIKDIVLVMKDGTQTSKSSSLGGGSESWAPGSQRTLTYDIAVKDFSEDNPPVKLLLLFNAKPLKGQYTVPDPNMRFDLTCTK